jgi:hypothetical protein
MKKLLTIFFLLSIFISLQAKNSFKSPKEITRVHNNIKVSILPKVELISVVQTISKYPTVLGFLMTKDSSQYKEDVVNYFKAFEGHPVIKMFDRLSLKPRGFNFSAPSNIMLYTDGSFQLKEDIELDDFVINRSGGIDSVKVFLNLLEDFAIKSSFNDFFEEHRDFYTDLVETTVGNLGPIDYISEIENFYGKKQKAYSIVLVSLYNYVGYGNSILFSNDQREIYNTMGPRKLKDGIPFFGNENYLKQLLRHEFSHPFINPLTEKYWDHIKDYSQRFDSIPEVARKTVCHEWEECVNEFTIRAIVTQLSFNESEELGLKRYKREEARGVSNLDVLLEKIRYYQSNREHYPTIDSYYKEILSVFKDEKITI